VGNYYSIPNHLFTIWQVSQTPFTIGHPSSLVQISSSIRTLLGGSISLLFEKTEVKFVTYIWVTVWVTVL